MLCWLMLWAWLIQVLLRICTQTKYFTDLPNVFWTWRERSLELRGIQISKNRNHALFFFPFFSTRSNLSHMNVGTSNSFKMPLNFLVRLVISSICSNGNGSVTVCLQAREPHQTQEHPVYMYRYLLPHSAVRDTWWHFGTSVLLQMSYRHFWKLYSSRAKTRKVFLIHVFVFLVDKEKPWKRLESEIE